MKNKRYLCTLQKYAVMVTVKINERARGSKQLIQHLHTLAFVEFEEKENSLNGAAVEFEALEKKCITGDELVNRVSSHIDELFDKKECVTV